jgi:transcriptional regulator with XRE-family HTH domain
MALSKRKMRECLRASGLHVEALCYRAGVSNSYWNALIYGGRGNPSADILVRLAEVLGCRVGDFFDDDDTGLAAAEAGDGTELAGAR